MAFFPRLPEKVTVKNINFLTCLFRERRKLVSAPDLPARGLGGSRGVFSTPDSGIGRGVTGGTLGAAQTRQGRCPCTLPKGMIPFGNLYSLRRQGRCPLTPLKGLVP